MTWCKRVGTVLLEQLCNQLDDFPIQFRFIEWIAVVTVVGKLDHESINLVIAAANKLVKRERYRIILDLQEPGVVRSLTLGVFMGYNI